MNVQPSIQNNNILNKFEQVKTSSNKNSTPAPKDSFISTIKKNDGLKYSILGLGLVATLLALISRKKIKAVISRLFKKMEDTDLQKKSTPSTTEPPVTIPKIPKPKISEADDPVKYAAKYVDNAICHAVYSEDLTLEAIEIFNKYGSREKLRRFASAISASGPNADKVTSAYVDLYTKYAKPPLIGETFYQDHDSCTLSYIVKEFYGVMSKDTILKVVKAYNKTSFDRRDVGCIKYFTEMDSFRKKFSTSDYKEIEDAVAESIEIMTKRHYARGGK